MPTTHGDAPRKTQTRLYRIWCAIKTRCTNQNSVRYGDYGGRGITICHEWIGDYPTFRDWALTHGYAPDLCIERRNNNGPYSPDNCLWITLEDQARNKRSSRFLTVFGETKTVVEWSEDSRCVVSHALLRNRLHGGWCAHGAITTPARLMTQKSDWLITHKGTTLSIHAWAIKLNLKPAALYARAHRGLSADEILAPVKQVAPYGSKKSE